MHTVIISIGTYGNLYAVECNSQELLALASVLRRAAPVRDAHNGTFQHKDSGIENRLALTLVRSEVVTIPATAPTEE